MTRKIKFLKFLRYFRLISGKFLSSLGERGVYSVGASKLIILALIEGGVGVFGMNFTVCVFSQKNNPMK